MKIIEYFNYGFRLDAKDEKPIIVCAPDMLEAIRIFSEIHIDEPHDVIKLGKVYLSDASYE